MPRVAVILAGCGRLDGSEIHESTLSLLYLAQGGATYQCFALDEPQVEVLNHITGEPMPEIRNQMTEAARIARGNIQSLRKARAEDFDALVLPGGSGAFNNLRQSPGGVNPYLSQLLTDLANQGKPIAAICIAPMLVARVLGSRGIQITIGTSAEDAKTIEATGARHVECPVDRCVVDKEHKIVSTPAYMLGPGIADVAAGIESCIKALLQLCRR